MQDKLNIDFDSLATATRIIRSVRTEAFEAFLDNTDPADSYTYGRVTAACEVAHNALRETLNLCAGRDPQAATAMDQVMNGTV